MKDTPESRKHVSEMCAAFGELLNNVGTVLEPHRQNNEVVERMTAVMDRLYAESREERRKQ